MAGLYNSTIEQGGTFSETYAWKDGSGNPVNITGYTAAMQIRDDQDALLLDVAVDGSFTYDAVNGEVTASVTADIDWRRGNYDLFLNSNNFDKKLLKGEVSVVPAETR